MVDLQLLHACRYVTVDEEAERALFYALVESSGNPATDPLVLWLNGLTLALSKAPFCISTGSAWCQD